MQCDNLNELFAALSLAQGEMTHATKDSRNPHLNSRYADLASVWGAIRAPLTKNGLSVIQLPNGDELETILAHKSGQFIIAKTPIKTVKNDAQGYGSGLTYARRYALASIVGIVQDDDDGNIASNTINNKPKTNALSNSVIKQAQKQEVNSSKLNESTDEQKRAAFDNVIKSAVVKIGVERMLEVIEAHGYNDPSEVQVKDFRAIKNAIDEIEKQGTQN